MSLLGRALQARPDDSELQLLTVEVYAAIALAQQRAGQPDLAEQTARQAVHRAPNIPESSGCLADLLWKKGRRDEAYTEIWRTLERYPEYDWGWSRIEQWPAVLERTEGALQRTREFASKYPESVRPALSLLAQLDATGFVGWDEALEAVARLLDRHPKLVQGHDLRAYGTHVASRLFPRCLCMPALNLVRARHFENQRTLPAHEVPYPDRCMARHSGRITSRTANGTPTEAQGDEVEVDSAAFQTIMNVLICGGVAKW